MPKQKPCCCVHTLAEKFNVCRLELSCVYHQPKRLVCRRPRRGCRRPVGFGGWTDFLSLGIQTFRGQVRPLHWEASKVPLAHIFRSCTVQTTIKTLLTRKPCSGCARLCLTRLFFLFCCLLSLCAKEANTVNSSTHPYTLKSLRWGNVSQRNTKSLSSVTNQQGDSLSIRQSDKKSILTWMDGFGWIWFETHQG